MADFTDPHRQGWPIIRARHHHHAAVAPPEAAGESPAAPSSEPAQPWQESSFALRKGLEVSEETVPHLLLREWFRRR